MQGDVWTKSGREGGSTTDSNIRVKKSRALRIIRVENVEHREIFV